MTAKQTKLDPKLQQFLNQIKSEFQPDNQELQRRITDAKQRHLPYLEIMDHGSVVLQTFQELILNGYKYELGAYNYHTSGGSGITKIRLVKPESVLLEEHKELERKITEDYHKSLERQIDSRIETLMQDAAAEAEALAAEQAKKEQQEMKEKLKQYLLS